tara:strand:- start:72 stop:497 length:426 start_codon:yes stop_codon:yes gene_type:complete
MRSYSHPILVVSLIGIFAILPLAFAEDDTPDQQDAELILPNWVKLVAGYWYDDKMKDQQFFGTIGYLIDNEIIILPTDAEPSTSNYIPVWVKNNAGWWANDQIDDQTFVNGLQYLVQIGSIQVQTAVAGASGGGGGGGGGY